MELSRVATLSASRGGTGSGERGEVFLDTEIAVAAFGQELSEREVVVLRLLAAGLSQREIATQLYISPNTVKTHLRSTYRKLGAATRAQALHHARDLGVLHADRPPGPARSPG